MQARVGTSLVFCLLAFLVLLFSLRSSASIKYDFELLPVGEAQGILLSDEVVDYALPDLSRKSFWPNAVISKLEMYAERDPLIRAQVALENADMRLVVAREQMKEGDYEKAVFVLTKSENYLSEAAQETSLASASGRDATAVMLQLASASLKHREVMELSLDEAPEDARPVIVQTMDKSKAIFTEMSNKLFEIGHSAPYSPFDS
jgi:hypothetical protein